MRNTNNLVKLTLLMLLAVVFAVNIGSNGCLWVGDKDGGNAEAGSSGAYLTSNPFPANGVLNVDPNAVFSFATVTGIDSYKVYIYYNPDTPSETLAYAGLVLPTAYRTRFSWINFAPPIALENGITYKWRVDSIQGENTHIGNTWLFSTKPQANVLYYIDPINAFSFAYSAGITMNLIWGWDVLSPDTVDHYDIYFSTNYNPSFVLSTPDNMVTDWETPPLAPNTTYYWKIVARDENNLALVTGPIWNFRSFPELTKPVYPNPALNAQNVTVNPTLSWASATTADKYDIYFGQTLPGTPTVSDYSRMLYRTKWTPPGPLSNYTTYYWKIVAKSNTGGSATGDTWAFRTKVSAPAAVGLVGPASPSTQPIRNVVLSWTASALATSYNVYFGTDTLLYRTNTPITGYYPGVLTYNTNYQWRVDARNSSGIATGTVWYFSTVGMPPPAAPQNPYPPDNGNNYPKTLQLSWDSGTNAVDYDVWGGTIEGSIAKKNTTPIVKTVYRTRYTVTVPSYDVTYYWKVVAFNPSAPRTGAGVSSPTWEFKVIPGLPGQVPDVCTPVSGTYGVDTNVTLTWTASTNTLSYNVYVGITSTLTGAHYKGNTTKLTYKPSGLVYNMVYYWRIDAKNSAGITPGIVWTFKTLEPPLPVSSLDNPGPGATNVATNIELQWTGPAADPKNLPTAYTVRCGTFAQLTLNTTLGYKIPPIVGQINFGDPAVLSPALYDGTLYYWCVDTWNAAGTTYGGSISQTFTTALSAPTGLIATPDADLTQIVLNWTDTSVAEGGFIVERSTTSGSGFVPIADIATPNTAVYTDSDLALLEGTTYYYQVKCYNAADPDDSAYCAEASATTVLPAPENFSATQNGAVIDLAWDDMATDESGYLINRSDDGGSTWTYDIASPALGPDSESYADASITFMQGKTYTYRIYAWTADTTSATLDDSVLTDLPAPAGFSAAQVVDDIQLTWTGNTIDSGGYVIDRYDGSDWTDAIASTNWDDPMSYNDDATALLQGKTYTYRIHSWTDEVVSSPTSTDDVTTDLPAPGGFSATYNGATLEVDLAWTGNPRQTSGGYIIERADDAGFTTNLAQVDDVAWDAVSMESHDNAAGFTEGNTYYYRIHAYTDAPDSAVSGFSTDDALIVEVPAFSSFGYILDTPYAITLDWTWGTGSDPDKFEVLLNDVPQADVSGTLRTVTYNNAPAGDYTFKVRAVIGDDKSDWLTSGPHTIP